MTVFKTLADLQSKVETKSGGGGRDRFLSLKAGENYRIRFRQEVTQDGTHYSDEREAANIYSIHVSPIDFRKKAVCTAEKEEFGFRCWACEQVVKNKKWNVKQRLIINILALVEGDWVPKIMEQPFGRSQVGTQLLEYAGEYNSVMDRDYKITRVGERLQTVYNLIPLSQGPMPEEDTALELFDASQTYRVVPPEEQEEYYTTSWDDENKETANAGAKDNSW